jgi:signal transduction histidine kinase
MYKKILIAILICFLYGHVYAQSIEKKIDSLQILIKNTASDTLKIEYYHELVEIYISNQPNKALKFGHKALALRKKIKYDEGNSYENLFLAHSRADQHRDSLLKYAQLIEQYYVDDERGQLIAHWCYAFYYEELNQQDKVIEEYLKCLDIVRASNDVDLKRNEGPLFNNIANVFKKTEQYEKAMKFYKKALEIEKPEKLNITKANILFNIATMYRKHFNKVDTAQIFLDKAYELYDKLNEVEGIATVLIERAEYRDSRKEFELANSLYFRALEIIENNRFGDNLILIYQSLAEHYLERKEYRRSIKYGEKALQEVNKQGDFKELKDLYLILDKSYTGVKNFRRAHEIRGLSMEFRETTNSTLLLNKVTELQTRFEVEQREIENELLKAETVANKKAIQNTTIAAIASFLALLLIGSWSLIIYRSNRQKQKYNEILKATVANRTFELEQANKNLEQVNYELRTFTYIASHDIKEPIRVISGYAGLIFKQLPDDLKNTLGGYFDTIKRSTSQLYTLIEDFAHYTTMSKHEVVEKQDVDLNVLTLSIVDTLQESIKTYNGEVLISELPTIQSSTSLLFTIFKNLIENGLKYNVSEKPIVRVTYHKKEIYDEIIISDNGIGINEKYYEKIFEMFKRLHSRGAYEGSGIGLAIVKLSIEMLGGIIDVESEEGKGTRFIIRLPR